VGAENALDIAFLYDATWVHHDHSVSNGARHIHLVGDQRDGSALADD
jgi:hypothetical protein